MQHLEGSRRAAPELSRVLREVSRAAADADRRLARRLRMRPLEYAAMGHVLSSRGTLGPVKLADLLGISSGSATELVDRLEQAGQLRRRRDLADRRRVALKPTEHAMALLLAGLDPLLAPLDGLVATFSNEEQATIVRYLTAAAKILRSYAEDDADAAEG
jgi:DNA-binding MarR family transcriptional regulator